MVDYFLGLDCSTQSLTAILINFNSKKIIYEHSINYDRELPQYHTENGIIPSSDDKVIHSYPLMWIEALDILFGLMKGIKIQLQEIKAISGSGQQHGTVYLNDKFEKKLENLDPNELIVDQIRVCFTRKSSPIWMDSSTSKQCEEIRNVLGGMIETIKITGSNTFERFSGPQIRKFYQENPTEYRETSVIHLVSSFMASILLGKNAPIDHGDGSGMNLMNIETKQWDNRALEATAPLLNKKLPNLSNSYDVIGRISPYFIKKYEFNPETLLITWSGDNPNSLIGTGVIGKGKVAISLGTSDTYFSYMEKLRLDLNGEGIVFGAPTGDYMSLICFKNGSLARENIKEKFSLNWAQFSEVLKATPPGNYGKIILPYFYPEIVPLVLGPKVYRFGLEKDDLEGNIRAIIECQFLSMRLHSEWIKEKPDEIYATGGASVNREILQVAADVFNTKVRYFEVTNSAALGAALRSAKSYYENKNSSKNWSEIINNFINIQHSDVILPNIKYKELYDMMLELYRKTEDFILKDGINPDSFRRKFIKEFY
ncbi:MAG: carbohydrate kinase [Candidatus Lokiarchaeota archaeon]|nr:carbohydrate kinase [Candidatus Lokiarchaeota archaeon]